MWDPNHQATTTLGESCGGLRTACRQRARQCRCKVCVYVRREKLNIICSLLVEHRTLKRPNQLVQAHKSKHTLQSPKLHMYTWIFCFFKNAHGNTRFIPFQLITGWFLRRCDNFANMSHVAKNKMYLYLQHLRREPGKRKMNSKTTKNQARTFCGNAPKVNIITVYPSHRCFQLEYSCNQMRLSI